VRIPEQGRISRSLAGALSPLLFVGLVASGCRPPAPSTEVVILTERWEFRRSDTAPGPGVPGELVDTLSTWLPATVPGTIHTDLLANDLIPDPFWRDRELVLQWIGEEDWVYRTTFQASAQLLEKERVDLLFHGLDTFADVRLNDRTILETNNMFRSWIVDVKGDLRPGENSLEILFSSPLQPALEARAALPYELPAGNDRGDPPSRVFVRKAAYHYGWDWGPRFVTSGIWRPVELLAWSGARIADLHLSTDSISDDSALLTADVEIQVSMAEAERRAAAGGVPATLTVSSTEGAFEPALHEAVLEPGLNRFQLPIQLPDPQLWWPNGLGEPHLYEAHAILKVGRRTDTLTTRFGLRTLELVTEPDSIGESFFFRVNGVPVFMKGANVIPLDHFSPRVTQEDYQELFLDAVGANMNMLRVWGGGIYEEDVFYDLADEHGILLWQDFMFANGMYPGDSLFLANVRAEATHQVRRLRGHPSLALWCGNNEMDEAWKNWGWARNYDTPEDSAAVWNAYEAIFHELLPEVVAAEDPDRRYWPSSPSLGWGDPESLNRGDSHYWGVWHGQEPFKVFAEKLPRFSSEFGFQAFPPMETVTAFTEASDRALSDPAFLVHQKHPIGNELITSYMERDYPTPAAFEDFVYVSQLLQARGMRTAFEAHRRAKPRTMGTLYWQLNDTWPVVSWSSRDYFGRWKALHFAAREAFAPILLSPVLHGDSLEFWGVSDLTRPVEGTLYLELLDFDGAVIWQASVPTVLPANQSQLLWEGSASSLLEDEDSRRVVLVGKFVEAGNQAPGQSSLLYLHPPKELGLRVPTIRIEVTPEEGGVILTLETDVLAKDVYLSLDDTRFSDNFFDLLPGRPRTVRLETDFTADEAEAGLRIRTLAEIPREGLGVEDVRSGGQES
jgi:beta-mannosidase